MGVLASSVLVEPTGFLVIGLKPGMSLQRLSGKIFEANAAKTSRRIAKGETTYQLGKTDYLE